MLSSGSLLGISHSFFRPRNITTDATYELAMSNYFFYKNYVYNCDQDNAGFALFITPFYQRSTNRNDPARYFLRNNRCTLRFAEDGTGDVNSLWFNLIAPAGSSFSSTLSIKPRREVYGAYLQGYFDLSCLWEDAWMSICTAAIGVRHNLRPCEFNNTNNGTIVIQNVPITNVISALNNPTWKFGKFSPCARKKGGIDDVQIKIGKNWFYNDCMNHYSPYLVVTAPTGSHSRADYVFEPLVGSRNGSVGAGINIDYTLWETECSQLMVMTDLKYRYVFGAHECRSFDLCPNGDWSRYLQVVSSNNVLGSLPGINFFTQNVKVTPRSDINWWLALHYASYGCWHGEVGYNLWYRQAECIKCVCPLKTPLAGGSLGIFGLGGLCSAATTNNIATIAQPRTALVNDPSFVALTAARLNKQSAAHPRAISHKLYGTVAREFDNDYTGVPCMASIGGSYEFAQNYAALDNWAVWAKFGIFF